MAMETKQAQVHTRSNCGEIIPPRYCIHPFFRSLPAVTLTSEL